MRYVLLFLFSLFVTFVVVSIINTQHAGVLVIGPSHYSLVTMTFMFTFASTLHSVLVLLNSVVPRHLSWLD